MASLIYKWLKSENTSSTESKRLGKKTRKAFRMTPKQYRKLLSWGREQSNVLERLMSQGRWDEIDFSKIPSRAGIIYRNAFAKRDETKERYKAFAKDKTKAVNTGALYPHDIAHRALRIPSYDSSPDSPERLMLQKYWDNLPNFYGNREENGIAIVDVSGSMCGTPMEAAVSMGAYMAEKAHGPFAGHFITFSGAPQLVKFEGVDITDKFHHCIRADWGMNTNIEAVFDLLLKVARQDGTKVEDMPERIYIFSDMQFDHCVTSGYPYKDRLSFSVCLKENQVKTLMERMKDKWAYYGYKLPSIVFWNLCAYECNIPAIGDGFSYVSGFSPVMVQQILSGKDGIDLMLEKLNSERYNSIK